MFYIWCIIHLYFTLGYGQRNGKRYLAFVNAILQLPEPGSGEPKLPDARWHLPEKGANYCTKKPTPRRPNMEREFVNIDNPEIPVGLEWCIFKKRSQRARKHKFGLTRVKPDRPKTQL